MVKPITLINCVGFRERERDRNVLFNDALNTFYLRLDVAQWVHPMKDRSDDPSHHERTLLPRSYISLLCVGFRFNGLVVKERDVAP